MLHKLNSIHANMGESKREEHVPNFKPQPDMRTSRRSRLSAHNLRIHTAAYPKQSYFPICQIQEARSQWEQDANNGGDQTPADALGFSYDGLSPQDIDMTARRKASMDTLKLYSGNLASLSMPMDRLIEIQPEKSPRDPDAAFRELEAVDSSESESELSSQDDRPDDMISLGSLRPSSDTLSVSREMFVESTRGIKEQGTRNWRIIRTRRRNTIEKTKVLRRTVKAG